jgi:hypothetical protein
MITITKVILQVIIRNLLLKNSTLIYFMENLDLKIELVLNYYFLQIKDLTKKFKVHRNPSKKSSLVSMLPIILPFNPLFIKNHYMKVHGVHIH